MDPVIQLSGAACISSVLKRIEPAGRRRLMAHVVGAGFGVHAALDVLRELRILVRLVGGKVVPNRGVVVMGEKIGPR